MMNTKKTLEVEFIKQEDKYILIPNNEYARVVQKKAFKMFIDMQRDFIKDYKNIPDKIKESNKLSDFFVNVFMNGDGTTFKYLLGLRAEGIMTDFESMKIKEDFDFMFDKFSKNEIQCFLMLDLIHLSNRRADCIIVSNEFDIELFDVSTGEIAIKIEDCKDPKNLTLKEKEQYYRKERQKKRIDSFKDKVKENATAFDFIQPDKNNLNVSFISQEPDFFDINNTLNHMYNKKIDKCYVPKSVCFLVNSAEKKDFFYIFPMIHYIDSPIFNAKGKPQLSKDNLDFIYDKNMHIAISNIYFYMVILEYTVFKIHYGKATPKTKDYWPIHSKINGKTRGIYIYDTRTKKQIPLSMGLLYKHVYMNLSIENLVIYISKLINFQDNKDESFHNSSFLKEKVREGIFNFFILDNKVNRK